MLPISRRKLAQTKLEQLRKGYCAYVESKELAQLIETQLPELPLSIHIDRTSIGCWYIPEEIEKEQPSTFNL